MLPANNEGQVRWLVDRLYTVSRELESLGIASPNLVLLTKSFAERQNVERILCKYFMEKYGIHTMVPLQLDHSSPHVSRFHFHELNGASIVLVDIETPVGGPSTTSDTSGVWPTPNNPTQ